MTLTEQSRLAKIRTDQMKHEATTPHAACYDAAFMLKIIDENNEEIRKLREEKR